MKIQRLGPASLSQVMHSLELLEQAYGVSTESFLSQSDPTPFIPEDEGGRWEFLVAQRDALRVSNFREASDWTPNYRHVAEHGQTRLPEVDREAVECGVAA